MRYPFYVKVSKVISNLELRETIIISKREILRDRAQYQVLNTHGSLMGLKQHNFVSTIEWWKRMKSKQWILFVAFWFNPCINRVGFRFRVSLPRGLNSTSIAFHQILHNLHFPRRTEFRYSRSRLRFQSTDLEPWFPEKSFIACCFRFPSIYWPSIDHRLIINCLSSRRHRKNCVSILASSMPL